MHLDEGRQAGVDQLKLDALVQIVALINAFNRINVTTGRTAEASRGFARHR